MLIFDDLCYNLDLGQGFAVSNPPDFSMAVVAQW